MTFRKTSLPRVISSGVGEVGVEGGLLGVHRGLREVIDDALMNALGDQEAKLCRVDLPSKTTGVTLATCIHWPPVVIKVEMMETVTTKQDRIGARVPHEVYETLCRAAELSGATVNQFLVQSALKEAQAVIEREEVIRLSPRDWNWLLDLMENPPKPTPALTAAMKRYQKAKRDDAGTAFNWEP